MDLGGRGGTTQVSKDGQCEPLGPVSVCLTELEGKRGGEGSWWGRKEGGWGRKKGGVRREGKRGRVREGEGGEGWCEEKEGWIQ